MSQGQHLLKNMQINALFDQFYKEKLSQEQKNAARNAKILAEQQRSAAVSSTKKKKVKKVAPISGFLKLYENTNYVKKRLSTERSIPNLFADNAKLGTFRRRMSTFGSARRSIDFNHNYNEGMPIVKPKLKLKTLHKRHKSDGQRIKSTRLDSVSVDKSTIQSVLPQQI